MKTIIRLDTFNPNLKWQEITLSMENIIPNRDQAGVLPIKSSDNDVHEFLIFGGYIKFDGSYLNDIHFI